MTTAAGGRGVVRPAGDIPGLFCAPATIDLDGAEIELVSLVARESRLQRALEAYEQPLDYVLIDMPPGTGDVQMGLAKLLPRAEMLVVTTPSRSVLEGTFRLTCVLSLWRWPS